MHTDIKAIILAAGRSERLNSGKTTMVEKICGQEVIAYPVKLLNKINIPTIVVVGYQKKCVMDAINKYENGTIAFVTQHEQFGTHNAIEHTKDYWDTNHILIMNGNVPLVTDDIITSLCEQHKKEDADITFLTAHHSTATNMYDRVVSTKEGMSIVSSEQFDGDPHEHCCINAGIFLVKKDVLCDYIDSVVQLSDEKEHSINEIVAYASQHKKHIVTISVPLDAVRAVSTFEELWALEQIKRSELIRYWMHQGVRFSGAQNVHIDLTVTIDAGSVIEGGVQLRGNTTIGKNAHIGAFSSVEDSIIGQDAIVHSHTIIKRSHVHSSAEVGPFAHVRNNTIVHSHAQIGNFVETKSTTIGQHAKAKHLSYLGDADIGEKVNIGAGTITANYDGAQKHKTAIKRGAFVGCNTSIIAPLTIGADAMTAAGSIITEDVPPGALAIARSRQINKKEYMHNNKKKAEKKYVQSKKDGIIAASIFEQ